MELIQGVGSGRNPKPTEQFIKKHPKVVRGQLPHLVGLKH